MSIPQNQFSYFSFNEKLEFEKKFYHFKVTLMYNLDMHRREFGIFSNDFSGPSKLLVYQLMLGGNDYEWIDLNNQDNSALIQELGAVILKNNI